jgi:hypothetical protein
VTEDANPPDLFSQEDYDRLSELLDLFSSFNLKGVLGLLHAIAVSPGHVPDKLWLSKILEGNHASGDTALARYCIELMLRLKTEVQDAVDHSQTITPDSDEINGCAAFAAGYVTGAELDPRWLGDTNHWTFASGVAYLADRLDIVPLDTLQQIEENLAPDPKKIIRDQLGSVVLAAAETFKSVRSGNPEENIRVCIPSSTALPNCDLITTDHRSSITVPQRVARNDPCPCGSGRKYKRCCMS